MEASPQGLTQQKDGPPRPHHRPGHHLSTSASSLRCPSRKEAATLLLGVG